MIPGTPVVVVGEVQHRGRRTIVAEGKMRDDQGRILAIALATFAVVEFLVELLLAPHRWHQTAPGLAATSRTGAMRQGR